jgi:hypothetical protein
MKPLPSLMPPLHFADAVFCTSVLRELHRTAIAALAAVAADLEARANGDAAGVAAVSATTADALGNKRDAACT